MSTPNLFVKRKSIYLWYSVSFAFLPFFLLFSPSLPPIPLHLLLHRIGVFSNEFHWFERNFVGCQSHELLQEPPKLCDCNRNLVVIQWQKFLRQWLLFHVFFLLENLHHGVPLCHLRFRPLHLSPLLPHHPHKATGNKHVHCCKIATLKSGYTRQTKHFHSQFQPIPSGVHWQFLIPKPFLFHLLVSQVDKLFFLFVYFLINPVPQFDLVFKLLLLLHKIKTTDRQKRFISMCLQ